MKIRFKDKATLKYVTVDVNYLDCNSRPFFYYGYYTQSGTSSSTNLTLSCLKRDNHGCPTKCVLSKKMGKDQNA